MPDAKDFYDLLVNRIVIKFHPKNPNVAEGKVFDLTLNKKMTYDQVCINLRLHQAIANIFG